MVEHREGPTPLVEPRDTAHAVDDVSLLGRASHDLQRHRVGPRGSARWGRSPAPPGKSTLEVGSHPFMGAVAGDRDHHVGWAVVVIEEAADIARRKIAHGRRRPQGVATQRVAREEGGLPLLGSQIRRLVGMHEDLVEDDGPLGVDVGLAQGGIPHDLAQDVEPQGQVLGQQPDVKGRVLLGRKGVAIAADLVK